MQFLEDPSEMTAEQRLTEIAMILASGGYVVSVPSIRCWARKNLHEPATKDWMCPAHQRVDVSSG
jgi:hypothetical protein